MIEILFVLDLNSSYWEDQIWFSHSCV